MITIHRTYSEITPESAEAGDFSDTGSLGTQDVTFRELVHLMRREFRNPSCVPSSGDTWEWLSTGYFMEDYRTCTEREEGIHFDRSNPERKVKYWRKAMRFAGIIR